MRTIQELGRIAVVIGSCALAACGSSGSGSASDNKLSGLGNAAPVISGAPALTATVGQEYLFEPNASDADNDTLTFSIVNRPEWATFSPISGRLRGTPTATSKPSYDGIQISVTDGKETVSLPAFKLTVDAGAQPPSNTPPSISGAPATTVVAGNSYEFLPTATDPDAQVLSFSIANKPAWADFDTVTGRLRGTPGAGEVGVYSGIVVSVSDGAAGASLAAFDISVTAGTPPGAGNQAPSISGTPSQAVTAGQFYSFKPTANDPDGQSLSFSIVNKPAWASFVSSTGELRGTPGAGNVGQTTGIVISVSDGAASASLPAFDLTVLAANSPPQISGTPSTSATVGSAYSFLPTASDPDGQTLVFTVVNKPAWASFSTTTGRLSGTTPSSVGTYSNIIISVSDGAEQASLPPFTLSVTNTKPSISGTPATTATIGQGYSFTPTASDQDSGQTLTFSITNKPAWAGFNSSNGRLSGTPTAGDVGTYSGIAISVSDGTDSASLGPFSITVAAVQTGTATLSWTAPTLNEDGSPLTNLAGYRIYYGMVSNNLDNTLDIPNAGLTTAVVENLSPATWYFAVKAYNTSNVESSYSNVASKTIQ